MTQRNRVVVLGVGNILLSDEGVGVHAVNALTERYDLPADVETIDGGTSAMDCLDQIAGCRLLVIADCMRSNREPGAITRLADNDLHAFFRTRISPHQVGLSDVLATLSIHGLLPARLTLIGMEPKSLALGLRPTPEIESRLPAMVDALVAELESAGIKPSPRAAAVAAS